MVDIAYCYGGITVSIGGRDLFRRAPRGECAGIIRAWLDGAEMERARQLIQDTIREAQFLAQLQAAATRKAVYRDVTPGVTFVAEVSGDCDPVTGAEYGVMQ
jgi:hypothetical protein